MSEYPKLRELAGYVAMMDRGDPSFILEGGTGRRIARALLAALDRGDALSEQLDWLSGKASKWGYTLPERSYKKADKAADRLASLESEAPE